MAVVGSVWKKCLESGRWEGEGEAGWTNYTTCYGPEMLQLYRKLYSGSSPEVTMNNSTPSKANVVYKERGEKI